MSPPHTTHEALRKSLHIAFGFGAIALRWLPWYAAAAVAALAIVGNWLLLHRIVGKRVARDARGYDAGIVIYPAAVLVLIVVFRDRLDIAGVAWAILAFGDGFATLAGKQIGGARIPWNRDKSWSGFVAFFAFGYAGAHFIDLLLKKEPTWLPDWTVLGVTVLVAAVVESLPLRVDDNVTVPASAALTMLAMSSLFTPPVIEIDVIWLAVNTLLAVAGYAARSVDLSGMIGGWILGAIIILCGGWPIYVALLVFFVIGSGATKLGYRRKAKEGLAQEKGGRRGFRHAFANAGVAAILSVILCMMGRWDALFLAAAASLATAAADTAGSEIGQLLGRRTFLPLTFRSVPRGTEGAISLEGTVASLIAAALVALASVAAAQRFDYAGYGTRSFAADAMLITFCGFAGAYIESIVGSWNRKRERPVPNDALNFFNTLVGALLALAISVRVA